ncbi:MAG: DUF2723 domain-containing protein, partial [Candidatus Hydrogenedentes bacterium]|nr:DUF2723 domain-containing protein [Candidatus Hydrogenedentota bacterium]
AILAGLTALAVYIWTLAPTVTGEDSGELVAAAYTLGIPHPTGYPLWCVLAHLFIKLLPIGSMAWRAAFMSAFFSAATVSMTALIGVQLTRNRWASVAGALALAFSFEFWEQSVIAEVYSLNAFLIALCFLFLFRWSATRRTAPLVAAGACFGLGLCNHSIIALAGPVMAIYVLAVGGFRRATLGAAVRALAAMAAALLVHLYLPVRSMANPPMDWGNPETLENFWDVVTRAQYAFIMTDGPRSIPRFLEQLRTFAGVYSSQFTPGIGWLAPVGAAFLLYKKPGAGLFLLAQFLVMTIGCIVIPNYGSDRMSIWINTTYWIPSYFIAALFIGVLVAAVVSLPPRRWLRRTLTVVFILAFSALTIASNLRQNDKSRYFFADDYARNVLATMAPGAIYFGDSDHALFPVLYLQIVEGLRHDITVANPYGYPIDPLFSPMPDEVKRTFAKRPTVEDEQKILSWLIEHSDRPIYTTAKRILPGVKAVNAGLLYRYAGPGVAVDQPPTWTAYRWHSLDASDTHGDWSAELILYDYHFARGRSLLDAGDAARGLEEFEEAAQIAPREKDCLNNLGSAAAEYGHLDAAIRYLEAACALDPEFVLGKRNLGRALMKAGNFKEALAHFDAILKANPGDPATLALKKACELRNSDISQ